MVARHAVSVGDGSGGCWLHERNTLITTLGDEDQQPRGLAAMAASTEPQRKSIRLLAVVALSPQPRCHTRGCLPCWSRTALLSRLDAQVFKLKNSGKSLA